MASKWLKMTDDKIENGIHLFVCLVCLAIVAIEVNFAAKLVINSIKVKRTTL